MRLYLAGLLVVVINVTNERWLNGFICKSEKAHACSISLPSSIVHVHMSPALSRPNCTAVHLCSIFDRVVYLPRTFIAQRRIYKYVMEMCLSRFAPSSLAMVNCLGVHKLTQFKLLNYFRRLFLPYRINEFVVVGGGLEGWVFSPYPKWDLRTVGARNGLGG